MVVGFISVSPSEVTGNSSGKPPASYTPRLTCSAKIRQMGVARVQVRPCVADPDYGPTVEHLLGMALVFWSSHGTQTLGATRRQTTPALRSFFSSPVMLRRHLSLSVRAPPPGLFLHSLQRTRAPQRQFSQRPSRVWTRLKRPRRFADTPP